MDPITILIVVIVVFGWIFQAIKKMGEVRGSGGDSASVDEDEVELFEDSTARSRRQPGNMNTAESIEREQARLLYQQRVEALRQAAARRQAGSSASAQATVAPPPPPQPQAPRPSPVLRPAPAGTPSSRSGPLPSAVRRQPPAPPPQRRVAEAPRRTPKRESLSDFKSFSAKGASVGLAESGNQRRAAGDDPFAIESFPRLGEAARAGTVASSAGRGGIALGTDRESLRQAWLLKEILDAPRSIKPYPSSHYQE